MWRRDIDRFDRACDHLLVIDRARRRMPPTISGQVVGTCRLMRRKIADRRGGFYSEGEFDLAPLLAQAGECLELGRSCVDPDYRSRAVIDRLWSGIADHVRYRGIGLLFGCASLPGTRPDELALTRLVRQADDQIAVRSLDHGHLTVWCRAPARSVRAGVGPIQLISDRDPPRDSLVPVVWQGCRGRIFDRFAPIRGAGEGS